MHKVFFRSIAILGMTLSLFASAPGIRAQGAGQNGGDFSTNSEPKKLPTEVILVKGAWSSASDSVTPVPEGGSVSNNVYTNPYFGLRYLLSSDWIQSYNGPPPSDTGYYVLAQFRPAETSKPSPQGNILIAAQDLFFALTPASSALELARSSSENLPPEYKLERPPTTIQLANHSFVRFDYGSPVADLHWHILSTELRCHALEFIFTSRDTKLVERLIRDMNTMLLSASAGGTGGSDVPVCIKDYANSDALLEREDPILTERRFNSVPVRIIIDKEGKVKHIHFLSAFPDQARAISDALWRSRFRPYLRDGQPMEVETGIMFGRAPRPIKGAVHSGVDE